MPFPAGTLTQLHTPHASSQTCSKLQSCITNLRSLRPQCAQPAQGVVRLQAQHVTRLPRTALPASRRHRHACTCHSRDERHRSSPASSVDRSASLDSEEVADQLLGSSQRKGAASVSADALSSRSQDGHSSVDGAHIQDGGHSHSHGPAAEFETTLHRALIWIYSHTGLLQVANVLRENTYGSIAISVLFAAAAITHWQAGSSWLSAQLGQRVSQAATAGIYVLAGIPAMVDLTFDLASLHIDTHVLMTLAVLGTLAIGGALEGALLLVLFQVSHTVEHMLTDRAQGNLKSLFDSIPESATLVEMDGSGEPIIDSQRQVKAADVKIGCTMLVKPGEQVPLDGDIVYGEALVSMQHITGEALPMRQVPGTSVPAGSQNHDGLLVLRATCASDDSTPARISKMAKDAQASKPELRRWIDTVGEVYSKCVIAATAAALIILPLQGVPLLSAAGQRGAFYRAMGLLTTASPCALVLVPLAYVSAIAAITSRGMLIKGGRVLDALAQCDAVAFDKTGTLTTGALTCTGITDLSSSAEAAAPSPTVVSGSLSVEDGWLQQLLQKSHADDQAALAAAAELSVRSNHPVSKAVAACRKLASKQLPKVSLSDFELVPGAGVKGTIQTAGSSHPAYVRFGSAKFAAQVLPQQEAEALQQQASSVGRDSVISVLVHSKQPDSSEDSYGSGALVRLLTFQDTLNEQSAAAVTDLLDGRWAGKQSKRHAVRVTMLTGDNQASAERFSKELGITDVRAGLVPEEKLEAVKSLRSDAAVGDSGGGVVMVGDGINDTPALAAADVGVAIATEARDAAGSAADIVLLSGSGVAALPFLLAVARRTRNVLRQNMALALGSIAALALPVLAGWLPLWVAVTLHEGSTLLVALNSLRLLHWPNSPVGEDPGSRTTSTPPSGEQASVQQQPGAAAA